MTEAHCGIFSVHFTLADEVIRKLLEKIFPFASIGNQSGKVV